jgi:hypothetical protein
MGAGELRTKAGATQPGDPFGVEQFGGRPDAHERALDRSGRLRLPPLSASSLIDAHGAKRPPVASATLSASAMLAAAPA